MLIKELIDISLYIIIDIYDLLYRYLEYRFVKYIFFVKIVIYKFYYISKKSCKFKRIFLYYFYIWKFKFFVDYKRKRWKNVKFKDFCEINIFEYWKGKYCRIYLFNYKVG